MQTATELWRAWDGRIRSGVPAAEIAASLLDDELHELVFAVDGRDFDRNVLMLEALTRLHRARRELDAASGILHQVIEGLRSSVDLVVATDGAAASLEVLASKLERAEEAARALRAMRGSGGRSLVKTA